MNQFLWPGGWVGTSDHGTFTWPMRGDEGHGQSMTQIPQTRPQLPEATGRVCCRCQPDRLGKNPGENLKNTMDFRGFSHVYGGTWRIMEVSGVFFPEPKTIVGFHGDLTSRLFFPPPVSTNGHFRNRFIGGSHHI